MPDCPIPLLDQNLLSKLHAQIIFVPTANQLHLQVPIENAYRLQKLLEDLTATLENRLEDSAFLFRVNPSVWADESPGRVKNSEPTKIKLKEGARTPGKRQYPLKTEALKGIQTFIQKFKDLGLIQLPVTI